MSFHIHVHWSSENASSHLNLSHHQVMVKFCGVLLLLGNMLVYTELLEKIGKLHILSVRESLWITKMPTEFSNCHQCRHNRHSLYKR